MSSSGYDGGKKQGESDLNLDAEGTAVATAIPGQQQAVDAAALLLQKIMGDGASEKTAATPPPDPMITIPDFDARDRAAAAESTTITKLTPKYGAAPRKYSAMLTTPESENERRFVAAVPKVTAFLNQKLAAMGSKVRVTESEVATNFLAEGGVLLIKGGAGGLNSISGFQYAGIDTIYDRRDSLKALLPDDLNQMMAAGANVETQKNERGENVHSLKNLTVEQAMAGNAAMFAESRMAAAADLAKAGHPWSTLTPREQFYWTTVYYNGGEGLGRKHLAADGMEVANKPWDKADDFTKYSGNVHFNASWRTATHELVAGNEGSGEALQTQPKRTIKQSVFVAEVKKLAQDEFVPFSEGRTTADSSIRARREMASAIIDCNYDDPSIMGEMRSLWSDLMVTLETLEGFLNFLSGNKTFIGQIHAIAHVPMPDYAKLTVPQVMVALNAVLAALPAKLPNTNASLELVLTYMKQAQIAIPAGFAQFKTKLDAVLAKK